MSGLSEPISETVLSKAEATVITRPINEASNFFDFKEMDDATGQNYWFFLNSKENVHKIKSTPTGIITLYLHSSKPNESWRGEEIGTIELAGLDFVVFKVFPKVSGIS